nr:MAG TPA: hypothetical protein [Inoviridae sp.]
MLFLVEFTRMVVLNITKRGEYYAKSRNCNGQ